MDIYVMNKNFQKIAVIDDYDSIIWSMRYYTEGDFEIQVAASPGIISILQQDFYLVRDKDIYEGGIYRNVMIIQGVELLTDAEDGDSLIVRGVSLQGLLRRRVVSRQTVLSGSVQSCIETLLNDAIISPSVSARSVSNFAIGSHDLHSSQMMQMQVTGTNLADVVSEICMTYGYGYDIYLNNGVFTFYLYEGIDRSSDQTDVPQIIFSEEYDNLISSDYVRNKEQFANVAYVAGEGEGLDRKIVMVGTKTGIDRYEVWIDSRNMSSNEGAITPAEYTAMLQQEGRETLAELGMTVTYEGFVTNVSYRELGVDFFLGDQVQVENRYGISAKTRISEVIESENEAGEDTVITFSEMEV